MDGASPDPFTGAIAVSTAIFLPGVAVAIATLAGFLLFLGFAVSKLRSVIARVSR